MESHGWSICNGVGVFDCLLVETARTAFIHTTHIYVYVRSEKTMANTMSSWFKWKCFRIIFLTCIFLACVCLFASSPWSMCLFYLGCFLLIFCICIQRGKSKAKCVHQAQSSTSNTSSNKQTNKQASKQPFNNKYISLQLQPFAYLYTWNRQDVVWDIMQQLEKLIIT